MKNLLSLAFSIIILTNVSGQNLPIKTLTHQVNTNLVNNVPKRVQPNTIQDRAVGDVVWSNDFSVPGDWIAGGPSSNFATNGWSIGTTTNGWYFGTTGNMGTTGNFARFTNGDPSAGSVVQNGPFTLEYSTPINLSGVPAPSIEFSQYGARFITLQSVEVSVNGGTTWIEVGNNTSITALTANSGSVYGQPDIISFNIASAISNNPSNVTFRFLWDGLPNGGSTNYIEYGWFIDDVKIIEGSLYDAEIRTANFNSAGLEYYKVPTSQLTGIEMTGSVYNNGALAHAGLYLAGSVNNAGNVFNGSSSAVNLLPGAIDTMELTTLFTPSNGIGTYDLTWSFQGANPDDIALGNDTLIDSLDVTDSVYTRDNGIESGAIRNVTSNPNGGLEIGNSMQTFGSGYINSVTIKVDDSNTNAGKLIYGAIYEFDGIFNYTLVAFTTGYLIQASDVDNFITIPIDGLPYAISPGDEYLVCAGHYGGIDEVAFSTAQPTSQGSVRGFISSTGNAFTLTSPSAVMIRLNISEDITVSNTVDICEGSVYSVGNSNYIQTGVYNDTLTAVVTGNDSIINTTLTVSPTYNDTVLVDICAGENYQVGNSTYTASGIYTDVFTTTQFGCDSSITTELTVAQPIDNSVTTNQLILSAANITGASYQWVDCNDANAPINGATNSIFEPSQDGDYAVIITFAGCSVTSECKPIIGLSIFESQPNLFSIYPNPTNNEFIINITSEFSSGYSIFLTDSRGRVIIERNGLTGKQYQMSDLQLASGVYFISLKANDQEYTRKIMIKNN